MSEKVRILHIIKTLNLGGAEVNLLNLLRVVDQDRFECHVAYSFGGELEPKFKEAGIKLFKYANKDYKVKSLATIGILANLAQYILNQRIQIVHTHNFSAHIWGSIAAKLTACKIVEHVHDLRYLDPEEFARRRGFNNQYKYIHKFRNVSDRVVVLTKQNEEFLIKEKIYPKDKIREILNGIPMDGSPTSNCECRSIRPKAFSDDKKELIVLTPVRVAPEKNMDLILRIVPEVIRQIPNAVFLIAGDGPLYLKMVDEIKKMGLENNIKMIGYHPDIQTLLKDTDVFLLPSFLELHSIAILEAMSLRIPVVISKDVGCNSEFIEDWQNGVLLDPFKDEGWSQAIVCLLKDQQLRQQMGNKGYQTCLEKFNIKDTVRRFEDLYVELTRV